MIVRALSIAPGPFADTDWTDPAVIPPDNAKRFRILSDDMRFAVRGRASLDPAAAFVPLGVMTVDAYVLIELHGGGVSRGKTIVEVEGAALSSQIFLRSSGLPRGLAGRLHLVLADVSAPALDVVILDGGRPL